MGYRMRQRAVAVVVLTEFLVACHHSTGPTHSTPAAVHPAGVIASSIALSGRPHGVTVAPNDAFCVSRIDASSIACGTITVTGVAPATDVNVVFGPVITVGATPAHVALDPSGQIAYTADQSGNTATIVEVPNARVV